MGMFDLYYDYCALLLGMFLHSPHSLLIRAKMNKQFSTLQGNKFNIANPTEGMYVISKHGVRYRFAAKAIKIKEYPSSPLSKNPSFLRRKGFYLRALIILIYLPGLLSAPENLVNNGIAFA
jgi:hypothetical protein